MQRLKEFLFPFTTLLGGLALVGFMGFVLFFWNYGSPQQTDIDVASKLCAPFGALKDISRPYRSSPGMEPPHLMVRCNDGSSITRWPSR